MNKLFPIFYLQKKMTSKFRTKLIKLKKTIKWYIAFNILQEIINLEFINSWTVTLLIRANNLK